MARVARSLRAESLYFVVAVVSCLSISSAEAITLAQRQIDAENKRFLGR